MAAPCGLTHVARVELRSSTAWPPLAWRAFSATYLCYQYFSSIPEELDEAARVDGAGWGQVMAYASMITLPVLALFVAFQRSFINSIASSGVKG